ncbi:MAG: bifunctional phosphopantothenoylcysteine decarboxylase/phosphopantothenate--cysteine ligase CoaBC [Fimbriimonadales bacterium]
MKTVVVGVTGSVAAYRAADVCRELMRRGFTVRVCLTRSAEQFVTRSLFEALTGGPVLTDVFDEPERGRMAHIDWAREASCILVCPATANAIATLACGQADDMFSTLVSASDASLVLAPAMNPQMYASQANLENMALLTGRGAVFVEPDEGDVACGEQGQGKLAEANRIIDAVERASYRSELLSGRKVVITAGPTREAIDPVRYLSNRSSGKMGFALASVALQMGAEVTVVAGPTHETPPPKAKVIRVESASEMLEAALSASEGAQMLIGAAAVADWKPEKQEPQKMKGKEPTTLRLVPNEDILRAVRAANPNLAIVAFAAETENHEEHARQKMSMKGVQAIVMNDVSDPEIGFDAAINAGVLFLANGELIELPKESKFAMAVRILEAAAGL